MHTSAKGNQLFCIVANVYRGPLEGRFKTPMFSDRGWTLETHYVHAKDRIQARLGYCRAFPNRLTHSIIDVALAVGFFHAGYDKSGEIVKDQLVAD
jgi:hypothetical protein